MTEPKAVAPVLRITGRAEPRRRHNAVRGVHLPQRRDPEHEVDVLCAQLDSDLAAAKIAARMLVATDHDTPDREAVADDLASWGREVAFKIARIVDVVKGER